MGFRELPGGWTHLHQEGGAPQLHGDRSSCTGTLLDLAHVPLHLAVYLCPLSYYLLYSKLANVNVSLSSVSCSSKWLNTRRKFGTFCLITGCSEAQVITWTCNWSLRWWGQSSETEPLTCADSQWLVSESLGGENPRVWCRECVSVRVKGGRWGFSRQVVKGWLSPVPWWLMNCSNAVSLTSIFYVT